MAASRIWARRSMDGSAGICGMVGNNELTFIHCQIANSGTDMRHQSKRWFVNRRSLMSPHSVLLSQEVLAQFPPTRRYLVGVSGGRDSVALIHSLMSLGYRRLIVCHLNH